MGLAIALSILTIGFTAIISQIVLIREFLIVFCGNELSIAFILASWLIGGFLGSSLAGAVSDKVKNKVSLFCACQIALVVLLPATIVVIRSIRLILNVNPGEIVPIFPIVVASFVVLLPVSSILGAMFSVGSRIHGPQLISGASRIGEVYILETLGAILGGVITSFVLIKFLMPMQIMGLIGSITVLVCLVLSLTSSEVKLKRILSATSLVLTALYAVMWLSGGWSRIEKRSLDIEWRGSQLIDARNSVYGNVAITKKDLQYSIFDNGLHLYTIPDKPTAEEAAHFALLEHPNPKKVLLIGGGAGGLVGEIAKHTVEKIDYVELDPLIIEMVKKHLGESSPNELSGPRVSIIYEDGRRYVKESGQKYDVIIINIGDPYTAQINRFYTLEFYREVRRIMNEGGVISFGLGASESYIGNELANFLRSIYATLIEAFPDVKVIPGETAYFIASNNNYLLTYDYNVLMNRAKERALELKYVREYYLSSRMSPELISYTENIVKGGTDIRVNHDFKPAAYYYGLISWAKRFRDSVLSNVLKTVNEGTIRSAALTLFAMILIAGFIHIRRTKMISGAAKLSVLANGYSQMSFQVIILLAFQMIYGFMYYKLGIILTAFMVGLAIGGFLGLRSIARFDVYRSRFALIVLESCLCIYPFLLCKVLSIISRPGGNLLSWVGPNIVFILLPVIAGILGGFIFPVAGSLCLKREDQRGRTAGSNYARDLIGACLGAVLTGVILIPVIGIFKTCILISALNAVVLAVLMIGVIII